MGEIGEALEDAEQLLIPGPLTNLDVAGAALRAERPEPRQLVAGLPSRVYGEAAECAYEVLRLALAGLPRILAEPDADPLAVSRGGIEQQSLDVTRIGALAHHVEKPVAAVPVAAEFDADGPIRVVELGLFGGGEIPIADNVVKVRRDLIDHRAPLALEIEPGGRPDLPIAAKQPLALEQRQRQQPGEIIRVDPQQSRVVKHLGRDECDADRPRKLEARRQLLRPRQVLHQLLGPIGPDNVAGNADVVAQHTGPFGDRQPALRVDPPRQEVGDPTVRVRVAGGADVRPHAAGRAVAADHVEELMRGEMRQLVETHQRNLRTLPVVDGVVELQVREFDLAAAPPAPLARPQMRGAAESWIEVLGLVP